MELSLLKENILAYLKILGKRLLNDVADAVFPRKCLICRSFFEYNENEPILNPYAQAMSPFLCPECRCDFSPLESPICTKCGIMLEKYKTHDELCNKCLKNPDLFGIARALGIYQENQTFSKLIHRFKYDNKFQLGRPFGILLFSCFIRHWNTAENYLVMPVPLHIRRFRWRGFNQAYLLIRDWKYLADDLDFEMPFFEIEKDNLVRIKKTKPQVGLNNEERKENIKDAFYVRNPSQVAEKKIILIDDVYTTGATVNECAKELLKDGAKQVDVLTLARAV